MKKIDAKNRQPSEARQLLLKAFSTCSNWPDEEAGIEGLTECLESTSIRHGIEMRHIVQTCLESGPMCPTPHDLVRISREMWEHKQSVFEASVEKIKQWEAEYGPAQPALSKAQITELTVKIQSQPKRDDELWKKLRAKFPNAGKGLKVAWPTWKVLAQAARELGYEDYAKEWEKA